MCDETDEDQLHTAEIILPIQNWALFWSDYNDKSRRLCLTAEKALPATSMRSYHGIWTYKIIWSVKEFPLEGKARLRRHGIDGWSLDLSQEEVAEFLSLAPPPVEWRRMVDVMSSLLVEASNDDRDRDLLAIRSALHDLRIRGRIVVSELETLDEEGRVISEPAITIEDAWRVIVEAPFVGVTRVVRTAFQNLLSAIEKGRKIESSAKMSQAVTSIASAGHSDDPTVATYGNMQKKKGAGRPRVSDLKEDARIFKEWASGDYKTLADCALALSVNDKNYSRADIERALQRHRGRNRRNNWKNP